MKFDPQSMGDVVALVLAGGALLVVFCICLGPALGVGSWWQRFLAGLDRLAQARAREDQFRKEWAEILTDLCGTNRTGKITSIRVSCCSIITILEPLRGEASPYVDKIMLIATTAQATGRLPDPPATTEEAQELSSCIHQVCRRITA